MSLPGFDEHLDNYGDPGAGKRYEDRHPESAARWAKVLHERQVQNERDESWTRESDAMNTEEMPSHGYWEAGDEE